MVFAIQNWLGESGETKKSSSQPAILSVGMSREYWNIRIDKVRKLMSVL